MEQHAIVRALGGRLWTYTVVSLTALTVPAAFGAFADVGWTAWQALFGACLVAGALLLGGILAQQRQQPGRDAP
jgi:hypothetical protein